MLRVRSSTALLFALALAACEKKAETSDTATAAAPRPTVDSITTEHAPETFQVQFETTKGTFVVESHRAWAPIGVDRFYTLVHSGFYDGARFFRVIDGFMAQFGISGNPAQSAMWKERFLPDDPRSQSNLRGRLTFANAGPDTRTTQLFINFRNNPQLDENYQPIGEVVEGMDVVDKLFKDYGEGGPQGAGPEQDRILGEGETYLKANFPKLDQIIKATLIETK